MLTTDASAADPSPCAMEAVCPDRVAMRTRLKAMQRAAEYFQAGDVAAFHETLTVTSFRTSRVCVTLANPALPDVPLVGVSQGFEQMTGYSRHEILGRNCRFLNQGCPVPAEVRHQMRLSSRTDKWFRGILVNRRKNGELFQNLLHMCWIKVGNSLYILGLQADVTHGDVDLSIAGHMQELDRLVDAIFAANVDAWAALQAADFGTTRLADFMPFPYVETQVIPRYKPEAYKEARNAFVLLAPGDEQAGTRVRYSNTFIEVDSQDPPGPLLSRMRRISSEPALSSAQVAEVPRLPLQVLQESFFQLSGTALLGFDKRKGVVAEDLEAQTDVVDVEELKSLGSGLHPDGCTPCSFYCFSLMGCNRGESCSYCHMDHPKRARRRGRKKPKGSAFPSVSEIEESGRSTPLSARPQQVLPAPTPAGLLPLLDALELLSPLPAALAAVTSKDSDLEECASQSGARGPSRSPPPTRLAHSGGGAVDAPTAAAVTGSSCSSALSCASRCIADEVIRSNMARSALGVMSLRYNEDCIVVALGQWKQVVPFVNGMRGPLNFAVSPMLPMGLTLRRHSGVISGVASEVTPKQGIVHRVTAECDSGSTHTLLHVLVLGPDEEDSSRAIDGIASATVSEEK